MNMTEYPHSPFVFLTRIRVPHCSTNKEIDNVDCEGTNVKVLMVISKMNVQYWCFDIETSENIFINHYGFSLYKSIILTELIYNKIYDKKVYRVLFKRAIKNCIPISWIFGSNNLPHKVPPNKNNKKKSFVAIATYE